MDAVFEPNGEPQHFEILLIEDNLGDVRLTQEVLRDLGLDFNLRVARDGVQALSMLHRENGYGSLPDPDLILLDLNLPRRDGREVLAEIKHDPDLRRIPVIVLTTSRAERDVLACYDLHANCYLHKPLEFDAFADLMRTVRDFWFAKAHLPTNRHQ